MSLANSIEINRSYLINSVITKRIYLDSERKCFLFFSEFEAKAFIMTHEDTELSDFDFRNKTDVMSDCFAQGANIIQITQNGVVENLPLSLNRVKLGFYNGSLNADISLLRQTKRRQHLMALAYEKFIVPIRIKNEPQQEIVYGIVRMAEDKPYLYLGFSDLVEYQYWADKVDGWKPLMIEFDTMCQIAKDHGFLINPYGNRLVLGYENMLKSNTERQAKEARAKK